MVEQTYIILSEKSVQCVLSHTSTVRFSYGTKIAKDMLADYKFIQFTPSGIISASILI